MLLAQRKLGNGFVLMWSLTLISLHMHAFAKVKALVHYFFVRDGPPHHGLRLLIYANL